MTAETEWFLNGRAEKNQDGRDLGCYFPRVPADPFQVVQSPPPVNLEQRVWIILPLRFTDTEITVFWRKKVFKL